MLLFRIEHNILCCLTVNTDNVDAVKDPSLHLSTDSAYFAIRCTRFSVKFGRAICELCERTDRQTDRQTDVLIAEAKWREVVALDWRRV